MAEIINEKDLEEVCADDLPIEEEEECTDDLVVLFGVMPEIGDDSPVTHGWEESK